jgi:hypothetical protein
LVALGALLSSPAAATPPPLPVETLAWLSGEWAEAKGDRWTEERWSRPRGGVMLGTSLSGRGGQAGNYEFVRIAADADGTLTYYVSNRGAPPVPFQLTSGGAAEVVFENPGHDYPTRIVYRRQGNLLHATISGPGGANPMSWRYGRARD